MHYLYILYSDHLKKYYVGETSNINNRLELHLNKHYNKAYTAKADDWEIVLEFKTLSKENARYLEKFIKRMKSKKFIQKIIDNPSILDNILLKNSPGSPEASGLEAPH